MNSKLNIKYRLQQQFRHYQTRQQLRNLPVYLYKDISVSHQEIADEIAKSSLISLLIITLRRLVKGK